MVIHTNAHTIMPDKALAYTYAKQHVIPEFGAENIKQVACNLVGLHSARLPTPFVSLYARVENFQTDDLHQELFENCNMIKLRCMRGTLHIVPLSLAPIVHKATLAFRLRVCLNIYRKLEVSLDLANRLKEVVVNFVESEAKSINEIICYIDTTSKSIGFYTGLNSKQRKTLIRTVVKHLWEEGILCYLNKSEHWGSEKRLYGYTPKVYPELDLNSISTFEAQKALVRYHINQYGPVTKEDIHWWSGLSKRVVEKCLFYLKDNLITVKWPEFNSIFFMTKSDFENFQNFYWQNTFWLTLLAYEDPSLKGYFESRYRYIAPQYYDTLFNRIGEARASIILNGHVVGIWNWSKKSQQVLWEVFEPLESPAVSVLRDKIQNLENFLRYPDQKQLRLL